MIDDLSRTLRDILEDELSELLHSSVEIVFERPDDKFNPTQTTVNLFLYDIRENTELRSNELGIERKNGQVLIHRPPLRVACTYLITAWPVSGEDLPLQEHRLLSQILNVLSKYPTIPERCIYDSLKGQEPPLPMIAAQAECFKNPAEFWTAIGNKMHPSITVTVTISLGNLMPPETSPMVITEEIRLGQKTSPEDENIIPETTEEVFHIGGQVTAKTIPKKNVTVTLDELGIKAKIDANGRYILGPMKSGTYTLCVQSDDTVLTNSTITVAVSKSTNNKNYDIEY